MKYILPFIVVLVLIAGCADSGEQISKSDPFIGGTTGVTIDFAEGSPPAEVYDGGTYEFDISVRLENKGEYTVPNDRAKITISGLNPSEFGGFTTETNPSEDLTASEKDSEGDIIKGPPVYVTFDGLNHDGTLSGNQVYPIRADVCYTYETRANTHICILENNLDTTKDSVCKVNENKVVYNSGSPVQITNFKEMPRAADKVGFSFTVSHQGAGEIYKPETECDKTTKTDEDKVWLEITTGIGSGLSCSSLSDGTDTTGYVRLYGGDIIVMCTQEVSSSSDFQTPVDITARFDYEDEKSAQILVKHATS